MILEVGGAVWREQSFRYLSFVVGIYLHYIYKEIFYCVIYLLLYRYVHEIYFARLSIHLF